MFNPNNPFQNNPFLEAFNQFNPFANAKASPFDMSALLTAQRRNAETISAVNQATADSMQALLRRMAEIFQNNTGEVLQFIKEVSTSSNPEATVARQVAFTKHAYENAITNTKELAEIFSKSNMELFDLVSKRFVENMGEAANVSKKAAKAA